MGYSYFLCIHCHLNEPPYGNPFVDEPLIEVDAAPYQNRHERVIAKCYKPNADLGNYDQLSFNIGHELARLIEQYDPDTLNRIVQADHNHLDQYGTGNAIGTPLNYTILPLCRRNDKVTQIAWGKAAFEQQFGRPCEGMWLPEMAVDYETLDVLAEQGIRWTILSEDQIDRPVSGAGPYRVETPGGNQITVFVRDMNLSNDIAFNLGHFGGAGRWAREVLLPRKRDAGRLTLIATDGSTFGYHWPGEEQFIYWLLSYEALATGYEMTTLAHYLQTVEVGETVGIKENTAWTCSHGLSRWATGCQCTPADDSWKGALRRAFDNVRHELDFAYFDTVDKLDIEPVALRNSYISVILGQITPDALLAEQGIKLGKQDADRVMTLLEAQYYRQCMYNSGVFHNWKLDDPVIEYALANARRAIQLVKSAVGKDLSPTFKRDLSIAQEIDPRTKKCFSAEDMFDRTAEAR
jgi:hypothetical protein